jgi:phospholipase D1/2
MKSRSLRPLSPRRGKEARNTSSATAQSVSAVVVDIADLQISRQPMDQINSVSGILKKQPAAIRPHCLGGAGSIDLGTRELGTTMHEPEPVLRPGSTVWRVEQAGRVALLVDAAAYFHAVRAALWNAQHSIVLIGWDIDPHVSLDADGKGGGERFCDLFKRLLEERSALKINILIWDMTWLFAIQRRNRPQRAARWLPERVEYRVDGIHPSGASHHQKILVVDDAIAFCGGADFTRNRWDTSAHLPHDRRRRTLDGRFYAPRHEVEIAVDGAAAKALANLARERWHRATGLRLTAIAAESDPWPADLVPDLVNVPVGISRTEPAFRGEAEVREVEALYLDAIASAQRWIYLESQYFTASTIGDALAARLAEPDGPEVVLVCSVRSGGRADRLVMDRARNQLVHRLATADRHRRFRAYGAFSSADVPIIIHSKVMVVDDRLLRVGSANLNNRSFGLDTECDVTVEAPVEDARARATIGKILCRLAGEQVGKTAEAFQARLVESGSLIGTIETSTDFAGRHLQPLDVVQPTVLDRLIGWTHPLDPLSVSDNWRPWQRLKRSHMRGGRSDT